MSAIVKDGDDVMRFSGNKMVCLLLDNSSVQVEELMNSNQFTDKEKMEFAKLIGMSVADYRERWPLASKDVKVTFDEAAAYRYIAGLAQRQSVGGQYNTVGEYVLPTIQAWDITNAATAKGEAFVANSFDEAIQHAMEKK